MVFVDLRSQEGQAGRRVIFGSAGCGTYKILLKVDWGLSTISVPKSYDMVSMDCTTLPMIRIFG
jgi:hypothetical protein